MAHATPTDSSRSGALAPWNGQSTLSSIALQGKGLAAILAQHGLDFCCGGRRELAAACAERAVDVSAVLTELQAALTRATATAPDALSSVRWDEAPATDIVRHLVNVHHTYTRTAFAQISPLLAKVVAKHGGADAGVAKVNALFRALVADLEPHLAKEEAVLFPYILSLEASAAFRRPPFQTVANPVRMMLTEHDSVGDLLAEMANATNGFTPPETACTTYRALYTALAELRADLLIHISLENNVLFPKALDLEQRRMPQAVSSAVG